MKLFYDCRIGGYCKCFWIFSRVFDLFDVSCDFESDVRRRRRRKMRE